MLVLFSIPCPKQIILSELCTHLVVVVDCLPEPVVLVVGGEDLGEEAEEGGVGDGRLLAEQERLVPQVLGKGLMREGEGF